MKLKLSNRIFIAVILIVAGIFRFYNPAWDQGYHLHPDERFIIMKVIDLRFPEDLSTFFTKDSTWNPNFFAYGSFPLYLLNFIGQIGAYINPSIAGYDLIVIAGRIVSATFDLLTVFLVFLIGKKVAGRLAGLIGSFFYASAVLPIQLSHFYAVDTLLTFFVTAVIYQLLVYYDKPGLKQSLRIGFLFGLAVATKISALVLIAPILFVPLRNLWFLISNLNKKFKPKLVTDYFLKEIRFLVPLVAAAFFIYMISSPYVFIDFEQFMKHTTEQSQMTYNAFVFPYTLQYVGKIPYLYELQNIFLWGLGPILATVCFAGLFYFVYLIFSKDRKVIKGYYLIILFFFVSYFWVVGRFSVGFMRYMLPVYPLFCLFGGVFIYHIYKYLHKLKVSKVLIYGIFVFFCLALLVWPVSFMNIYTKINTRVTATQWIHQYIPDGKAIAQEHWDDPIPLYGSERYQIITYPLYEPDTEEKWINMNNLLSQTDYIVIASNRLYVPLQRMTNCESLPPGRCYPITSQYYKKLFEGEMGFQKIAEFRVLPKIPFTEIYINDQSADESFTVYDHPKVMIFQKIKGSANFE